MPSLGDFRTGLCLFALLSAASAYAQKSSALRIDAPADTRLRIAAFNVDSDPDLASFFRSPANQDLKPYAVLLTNSSQQALMTVTLRWTFATPQGERVAFSRADSFVRTFGSSSSMAIRRPSEPPPPAMGSTSLRAPLSPGETLLAAPGLFFQKTGGGGGGTAEFLSQASNITVALDAAVLQDGEVIGPDDSHTVENLKSQKAAADAVVTTVRNAEQGGQDPIAALRELAFSRPARGDASEVVLERAIARRLMNSPNWKKQFAELEAVQLPNFHR